MKRKLIVFLLVTICFIITAEQLSAKCIIKEFSLKLSGGHGTMQMGDLNTYYENRSDFFDKYLSFVKDFGIITSRTGDAPKLDKGMDMFAELMAHLTKNFALSLGFGYMRRTAESEVILILQSPDQSVTETTTWKPKPRTTVYPILFSAYYFLPVVKRLNIYIHAGIGYYFGKQSIYGIMNYGSSDGYSATDRETGIYKGTAIGYHGGLGVEFKICSNIAFFVEGKARSATIKELTGERALVYSYGTIQDSGTVWYVEREEDFLEFVEKNYRVEKDKPDASWLDKVRNWKVDLSGVSALVGFKISFGKKN
jgi:opacity protein-like surface antigen